MLTLEVFPFQTLAATYSSPKPVQGQRIPIENDFSKGGDSTEAWGSPSERELPMLREPLKPASLPAIHYAYDPVPAQPRRLSSLTFQVPDWAVATCSATSVNSFRLDPRSANLPYRSLLPCVRASKHWESNLGETLEFLRLLAADDSPADIEVNRGITLTKLAKTALGPSYKDRVVLAAHYMFPAADEERMRLIAALMVMYFVFDDKAEETSNDQLCSFRDDFFKRLQGPSRQGPSVSAIQIYLDSLVRRVEVSDLAGGNGGIEMIESLRGAFTHIRPDSNGFQSVSQYLHFRRQNVGASFVIAAIKFSIQSSVPSADPRFSRFLHLFSDHLGIVNDLASYDKELRALEQGETSDMINIVDVIKTVTGLRGTNDAKAAVWALQLQIEQEMLAELESMKKGDLISNAHEWWFLETVIEAAAGHVMFCMTTSRYGGEAARLPRARNDLWYLGG